MSTEPAAPPSPLNSRSTAGTAADRASWGEALRWTGLIVLIVLFGLMLRPPPPPPPTLGASLPKPAPVPHAGSAEPAAPAHDHATRRTSHPPKPGEERVFGAPLPAAAPAAEPTPHRESHPPRPGEERVFGAPPAKPSDVGEVVGVEASVETEPADADGDDADDPAIWVHPADPSKSLVLTTNKKSGVRVYGLDGRLVQHIAETRPNNIDVLYARSADGTPADLAIASDAANNSILIYRIDAETGELTPGTPARIQIGLIEPYGLCACAAAAANTAGQNVGYVFVGDEDGNIEQWLATGDPHGWLNWSRVRQLRVESRCEGMLADPVNNALYVAEEDAAVWRFELDPASAAEPVAIERARPKGRFTPDAEGLACVRTGEHSGYLIVSSQGDGTFLVYRREKPNEYVGAFRIGNSAEGVDGVSRCDGVDAVAAGLGSAFAHGLFVCQDGENPGANQNFKLVPWERIARAFTPPLDEQPADDPRPPRAR